MTPCELCWGSFLIAVLRFQITSSQLISALSPVSILVLAESEAEKKKWVRILESLQSILTKNLPKTRQIHVLHEAYDASLPIVKSTLSAAVLGSPLLLMFVLQIRSRGSRNLCVVLTAGMKGCAVSHVFHFGRSRENRFGNRRRTFCCGGHQRW